ncbi:MAG TPA: glycosyltransferase [Opitutaceae bacterium]|nr:glycosyltransferase [Opitutaceae bacterium]HND60506.1 glycosyltransferase [Opitutaceae bacterium]
MPENAPSIAVAIPCYQEEHTIARVVADFRQQLPEAAVYVFDNNCTDRTAEFARAAGATVIREKKQGKGHVVTTIFELIDADIIVMVDGDGTYDAGVVRQLVAPIIAGDADMMVAARLSQYADNSFRRFHVAGNQLVCGIINRIFGSAITDIFSGYRAFSRDCALTIPITSRGFDVETELTVQTLYRGLVIREIEARYGERPSGSFSKLNTVPDGLRVLLRLFLLLRAYKPLTLFGSLFIVLLLVAAVAGLRPAVEFAHDRHIESVASAVAASSALLLGFMSLSLGLMLSSVNQRLLELERVVIKRIKRSGSS